MAKLPPQGDQGRASGPRATGQVSTSREPGEAAAGSKPALDQPTSPGLATPGVGDHVGRKAIGEVLPPLPAPIEWTPDMRDAAIIEACAALGDLLGIPPEVRTWRRIRDELATLRQALHIEGEQTATEAARGLEDVAAHVIKMPSLEIGEADEPDGGSFLICGACGACGSDFPNIEHEGDCLLALAWRALGKPEPVGYP